MNPHTCADSIRAEREQQPADTYTHNLCKITILHMDGTTTSHIAHVDSDSVDYSDLIDALIYGAYQAEDEAIAAGIANNANIDIDIIDSEVRSA